MKRLFRWSLIIVISLLLVLLGGYLFINVVVPATSWIWYEQLPDGGSRVHARALLFIFGLLLFSLATILAIVTRVVDWALFPNEPAANRQKR